MVWYIKMVWYASIFAKKYCTLVRYALFVMVRIRYIGMLYEFTYETFLVHWYGMFSAKPVAVNENLCDRTHTI